MDAVEVLCLREGGECAGEGREGDELLGAALLGHVWLRVERDDEGGYLSGSGTDHSEDGHT